MRRGTLIVAGLLAALALAAIAGASTRTEHSGQVKIGGTLLFGAEQEVACLNLALNPCNALWGTIMENGVIRGAYVIQPDFSYRGDLASRVRLQLNPMRLTYELNRNARWSDGTPVTAKDFIFTWKTLLNPKYDIVSRNGYDDITSAKASGGGKVLELTFKKNYADWKDLFGYVLPQHALQGADFNTVWNDGIVNPTNGKPISDGPFVLTQWQKGSQITLVRNTRWWGPHRPYLNSVIFRFLTNTNTEIQQVRGGEVDAIYPQPQFQLADLRQAPGLVVRSSLGPSWEHIDIQQGPKGNPLAKNLWVRQALILSVNRNAVLQALFGKLNPSLQVLNNILYFNNYPQYKNHWGKWNYNPAKAKSLLESHGCKRGGDGIYSCSGTRLTFAVESTRGNQLREFAFTIIQDQLKKNGIEVTDNFKPSSIAFGQDLVSGNYDLFMFGWTGSPDPSQNTTIWSCPNAGGTQNYMSYCNVQATRLLNQADQMLKATARVDVVNRADALISNDIPTIPLYQKPTFLVFHSYVKGMLDNVAAGPTYNLEDWWMTK